MSNKKQDIENYLDKILYAINNTNEQLGEIHKEIKRIKNKLS